VNNFIDRTELPDSPFNIAKEPFNFSASLGMFNNKRVYGLIFLIPVIYIIRVIIIYAGKSRFWQLE